MKTILARPLSSSGLLLATAVLALFATGASARNGAADASSVTVVYNHVLPNVPGKSLKGVLVDYAPGGFSPAHTHPQSAFIYASVLEGAIRSQVNGGPIVVYKAGDSFSEMPGDRHGVSENASTTHRARLLAVFVVDTSETTLVIPTVKRCSRQAPLTMDASYVPALAGSAVGALASFGTTWINQNSQARAVQLGQDRARREALYGEFIREASKLFGDAFEHGLEDPAKLVQLYAIVGMIRLFGQQRTLTEAEAVMREIGATYFAPNKELRLFADIVRAGELDPLCAFSDACRDELRSSRS